MPLTDRTVATSDQRTNDLDQAIHTEQELVALRNASGLSQRQFAAAKRDVVHVYKGPQVIQLGLVRCNTTCDMPFMAGEKWTV